MIQVKIKEIGDKIIISHNREFFILKELNSDRYRISNMNWNYGIVQDGEYGIMLYQNEIYWWYTEEGGITVKKVNDLDNLATYLSELLPQSSEYFYLIVASLKKVKIIVLPKFLLDNDSYNKILVN